MLAGWWHAHLTKDLDNGAHPDNPVATHIAILDRTRARSRSPPTAPSGHDADAAAWRQQPRRAGRDTSGHAAATGPVPNGCCLNCRAPGHRWEECQSITGLPLNGALRQFARLKAAEQQDQKRNKDKGDAKNAKGKSKHDGKNANGKGKGNKGKGGKPWRNGASRGSNNY